MFLPPDDPRDRDRMARARSIAHTLLDVAPAAGAASVWGYAGRTLSSPVTTVGGPAWLRLVAASDERAATWPADGDKLWTGPLSAARALPVTVPRPRLIDLRDFAADAHHYRAELYELLAGHIISPSPVPAEAPDLSDGWWDALGTALTALAKVPTTRIAVREEYILRRVPEFTGVTVDPGSITWVTAHGDLHWSNLAVNGAGLTMLDWEGWGRAPAGYDAAMLYAHSLPHPGTARRVRAATGGLLDTAAARPGVLTAATEILQAAPRVPFYAALAPRVRRWLGQLRS